MSGTGSARGFTVFEMLVVLAIVGLIGGLAWPRVATLGVAQEQRAGVAMALATLRTARAAAIRRGAPMRVWTEADGRALGGADGLRDAPGSVRFAVEPEALVFGRDGSSNGGTLRVVGANGAHDLNVVAGTGIATRAAP